MSDFTFPLGKRDIGRPQLPPGHHVCRHHSLLADGEKRLLIWLAERMPAPVTSDHLSLLGLASMAGVGVAFYTSGWWPTPSLLLVPVLLLVNWFGDSLDGTLARVRRPGASALRFLRGPRHRHGGHRVPDGGAGGLRCDAPGARGGAARRHPAGVERVLPGDSRAGRLQHGVPGRGPDGAAPPDCGGRAEAPERRVDCAVRVRSRAPVRFLGGAIALGGLALAFIVQTSRNAAALYREETLWR